MNSHIKKIEKALGEIQKALKEIHKEAPGLSFHIDGTLLSDIPASEIAEHLERRMCAMKAYIVRHESLHSALPNENCSGGTPSQATGTVALPRDRRACEELIRYG